MWHHANFLWVWCDIIPTSRGCDVTYQLPMGVVWQGISVGMVWHTNFLWVWYDKEFLWVWYDILTSVGVYEINYWYTCIRLTLNHFCFLWKSLFVITKLFSYLFYLKHVYKIRFISVKMIKKLWLLIQCTTWHLVVNMFQQWLKKTNISFKKISQSMARSKYASWVRQSAGSIQYTLWTSS